VSAGCAASSEAGAVIGTSDGTATEKQEHTQEALKMKPTGGAAGEAEVEGVEIGVLSCIFLYFCGC